MTVSNEVFAASAEFPAVGQEQRQRLVEGVLTQSGKPDLSGPEARAGAGHRGRARALVHPVYAARTLMSWLHELARRQRKPSACHPLQVTMRSPTITASLTRTWHAPHCCTTRLGPRRRHRPPAAASRPRLRS